MAAFSIEVQETITTIVDVEAGSLEEAVKLAAARNFPLPPRDERENIEWIFQAPLNDDGEYDPDGDWTEM